MSFDRHDADLTQLLNQLGNDDVPVAEDDVAAVYRMLRGLAGRSMRGMGMGARDTVQPTALVHEAWIRLARPSSGPFQDRTHFMRVAARAMRCILVSHIRHRQALKRGGDRRRVELDTVLASFERPADLVELDAALTRLADEDDRAARIVELRFFAGCSMREIAASFGTSERTIQREWRFARAWLHAELDRSQDGTRNTTNDGTTR